MNDKQSANSAHLPALGELLLALADDEFVTGYANSEWTGIAPLLEEDIAFSSLAQDELGHARVLYELLSELQIGDWRLQIDMEPNLQSPISNLQSPSMVTSSLRTNSGAALPAVPVCTSARP